MNTNKYKLQVNTRSGYIDTTKKVDEEILLPLGIKTEDLQRNTETSEQPLYPLGVKIQEG